MSATPASQATMPSEPIEQTHADLPVIEVWKKALMLPVNYAPTLIRIGWAPALISFAVMAGVRLLTFEGIIGRGGSFWLYLIVAIVFTPFSVGWTQLAINGQDSVARRAPFTFGRTELFYLLAMIAQQLVWVLLVLPALLVYYAQQNFEPTLMFDGVILLLALFIAIVIGMTRTLYIFPALAVGRYQGIGAAWRQSRCSFERLLTLELLARAPWAILIALLSGSVFDWSPLAAQLTVTVFVSILAVLEEATSVGAIALAWRWRIGESGQSK
jgi:hypothetical protein